MATKAKVIRNAPKRVKAKSSGLRIAKVIGSLVFLPLAVLLLAGGLFFGLELNKAADKIPRLATIMETLETNPTRIYSADKKLIYESLKEYRKIVSLKDVPEVVIQATLAAEDKRFYEHNGVDPWAVARQAFTNVRSQRISGGASTLSMQLAKRLYTSNDQTFRRKIEDAAIALQMERTLTKSQILELYINQVFYGAGSYGVAAAAERYFGKDLKELSIAEAAMLARCVRVPSRENPYANMQKAIENRNAVLGVMRDEKMITEQEYQDAKVEEVKLRPKEELERPTIKAAPYFVRFILDEVKKEMGEDALDQGLIIETTVNIGIQEYAESRAKKLVEQYRRSGVRTTAFMLMNRSGEVLCMIGGVDYKRNQFNIVTQGSRQPGSAMKPLVYGAFFEQGHNPYESIDASTYRERDGDKEWEVEGRGGSVSVMSAIAFSMNPPAVRAMKAVGPQTFVRSYAPIYGIKSKIPAVPSLVLGSVELRPIELATAYSVFQQNGNRLTPYGIKRVTDAKGQVLMTSEPKITRGVLSSGAAEDVDRCLREVVTRGSGTTAGAVKRARGKTGTTNENKDAWFVGYTDNYIAVAWVGNEQYDEETKSWKYRAMSSRVMGGLVPIRLWRDVMLRVQDKLGEPAIPRSEFQRGSEYNTAPTNIDGENFESREERIDGPEESAEDPAEPPSGTPAGGDTPTRTPDGTTPGSTPSPTPDRTPPAREPDPKPSPDDPVEPVPTLPDDPGGTGEPGT